MKNLFLLLAMVAIGTMSFATPPADRGKTKKSKSLLTFPVAGFKSIIKDKWGASRGGGIRKHKGIDIHARKGTPVVAICDGVIVNKDHTPIGGNTLWLKSPDETWTAYYAHLDKQLVKEGQYVRKGQVIGTVGNTGNARTTPSHLHFGIAEGDEKAWVNPLPYVQGAAKVAAAKTAVTKKKVSHTKKKRTH